MKMSFQELSGGEWEDWDIVRRRGRPRFERPRKKRGYEDYEPAVKRRDMAAEPPPLLVGKDQAIEHPGRMGDVEDEEDAALIATEEKGKEHVVQEPVYRDWETVFPVTKCFPVTILFAFPFFVSAFTSFVSTFFSSTTSPCTTGDCTALLPSVKTTLT